MKKIIEMGEPEKVQDKDLTDFYAVCGLEGSKVNKIVQTLMGYFENDRKNIIKGIEKMPEEDYVKYFLQYLGEYQSVMKDPRKADRIIKLMSQKTRTPEEEKEVNDYKKEHGIK